MDFTRRSRHRKPECKPLTDNLEQLYPHNVMIYRVPPTDDITLQEFEDLALERLKLLRIFEQASSKNLRVFSDEWKESIKVELNREGLKGYLRLFSGSGGTKKEQDLEARRRDYLSHFILRLAYCRSQDLKRWFITREMEIFKYKFSVLSQSEIKRFLEINNLKYTPLTDEQKNEVKSGLFISTMGINNITIEKLDFYKVHFTEVLDLIRSRKCYLKSGYAYVSSQDFVSIISRQFQLEIERGLNAVQRSLPSIESDERIFHLLKGLHTSYTGKDYTVTKNTKIPIECIDQLSKKSFPLCMRMCHEILRTKHHHKHGGRLQYGLFLKGIGVTLEDSLKFWRDEFTKIMDLDKFEKNYAYNIRHNYGKEGSMINYTPHSCMKIITTSVGPQDTHGCPFKIYDQSTLKLKLSSYGLSVAHIQEVVNFASKGHYQLACTRYFEITHDTTCEQGITHPNQYFELSQTVMGNREPSSNAKNPNTPNRNQQQQQQKKPTVTNGRNDKTALMDANDDDELWNIAETQETIVASKNHAPQVNGYSKQKPAQSEWADDDFDMSQVESMEF